MSNNLKDGTYTITSLVEGEPKLGVNLTLPAFQQVNINAPATDWTVRKVEGEEDQYILGVGGYSFTGSLDKGVIASIHPEQSVVWYITHQEKQDAYTIAIKDAGTGWTVVLPQDSEGNASMMAPVDISLIVVGRSFPPHFLTTQLFRFNPIG
ncbi:hypothetical protein BDN67DRAFT_962229 [Paxillus ammoniavirescens]|nr:hypothetical protein BDN67DRAFT_962229 [Paxillus ammoniavirescens]